MRIVGMTKTDLVKKYPSLTEYKKDKDFPRKAYQIVANKIMDGLNIQACLAMAREKLDFGLVSALDVIDDLNRGKLNTFKKLDKAVFTVEKSLQEFKSYFYTPPTHYRKTSTLMFLKQLDFKKKLEISLIVWVLTGIYVEPLAWKNLINEVVAEKVTYWNLQYADKGTTRSMRIKLKDYLFVRDSNLDIEIVSSAKEQDIVDIINLHYGEFKISSVFAIQIIKDMIYIFPSKCRKEYVSMNLFLYQDYEQAINS